MERGLGLAEEAAESLGRVERRGERASAAVHRLQLVGAPTDLVTKLLCLSCPGPGDGALAPQPVHEPPHHEAHDQLEPEREGHLVDIEAPAGEPVGPKPLEGDEDGELGDGDRKTAGEPVAQRALDQRKVEKLANRRALLEGVHEDEDRDDSDVECERGGPEHVPTGERARDAGQSEKDPASDREDCSRRPGPHLVAVRIGRGQEDLDRREGNRGEPNPGDPAVGRAQTLDLGPRWLAGVTEPAQERRSSAHSACSRSIGSGSSA